MNTLNNLFSRKTAAYNQQYDSHKLIMIVFINPSNPKEEKQTFPASPGTEK
jgi:hypothetical protein